MSNWSTKGINKNGNVNFSDLLKDEYAVILLQGKNNFGDMIYCYLKVALPDIEKLRIAMASGTNFNASDFGTVVAAGRGEPTSEVKAEMALSYPMLETPKPFAPNPGNEPIPTEKKGWDEY